jgi:hypothetical protein
VSSLNLRRYRHSMQDIEFRAMGISDSRDRHVDDAIVAPVLTKQSPKDALCRLVIPLKTRRTRRAAPPLVERAELFSPITSAPSAASAVQLVPADRCRLWGRCMRLSAPSKGVHPLDGGGQEARVSEFQKECQQPLRSWARKAVMAVAPAGFQCIPGPLSRRPTSCRAVDSIIPVPICQFLAR